MTKELRFLIQDAVEEELPKGYFTGICEFPYLDIYKDGPTEDDEPIIILTYDFTDADTTVANIIKDFKRENRRNG